MFKHGTRRKPIEYEKDWVKRWKQDKTFEKSVENRPAANSYIFYDGPPFITGVPHHGTLLTSIVKDTVPRYWTMKGKRVERRWGWDCHGLPAEVFTEKKLGIRDKRDIGTKISLEEYITTCRSNMVQTGNEWEDTIDRIGRWVNFKGAYKTMDKEFMESVWWAFKKLYDDEKIYEGERVLLYCTRDATPLSKAEIAMDNSYKDVVDPSVYVKFQLENDDRKLLAWTTTPWTLPSNSAVAVNKSIDYSEVKYQDEVLIVAQKLVEKVFRDEKHQPLDYEIVKTLKGDELVGKHYQPLFNPEKQLQDDENAFRIWHADFVTDEDGTGIAHESPAYGEDDYELSKKHNIPWVMSTDENGFFTIGDWTGEYVWDVNKQIAKDLKERGIVWKIDYIEHSYPHCYRCHTKLMYRAHPSWFMDIDGQRTTMLEENSKINWFPAHIKHGRSEKTMLSAPDWNLSRDRFWATPMPVWKGLDSDGNEHVKVVGSYEELKNLTGKELDDYHRPWVDELEFEIDGIQYRRIEKVMDCWFESGSMPFAQFHYPFENKLKFENNFPADFIVEYVPQVRAWFYYMHSVSVGLFGKGAFQNALVHGTLAGNDGRKMSKSFGNYTDPNELMDKYSADALRLLFLSSTLLNGEDYSLVDANVADVSRKLSMIWNMYDFFTMYAEVDGWEPNSDLSDPSLKLTNKLDLWIVARVHELVDDVDKHMQTYDIPNATKSITPFIDDASNWYVRRSRKRFWKTEDDMDKSDAYSTLYYVLVKLSQVLAPFTPFLAEELHSNLTGGKSKSVHLMDWPLSGAKNDLLVSEMAHARKVVTAGLSLRAKSQIKLRQPLAKAVISSDVKLSSETLDIIRDELNVKNVEVKSGIDIVEIDTTISQTLRLEGISREVIRTIQALRKKSELSVDDRIKLSITTDSKEINAALEEYPDLIKAETLSVDLDIKNSLEYEFNSSEKIEGSSLTISIEKE